MTAVCVFDLDHSSSMCEYTDPFLCTKDLMLSVTSSIFVFTATGSVLRPGLRLLQGVCVHQSSKYWIPEDLEY